MDFTGLYEHLPSTAAGVVALLITGAVGMNYIEAKTGTVLIGAIAGICGLLFKHQDIH